MRKIRCGILLATGLVACAPPSGDSASATFTIELAESAATEMAAMGLEVPVTGRAYVLLTRNGDREPRQQAGILGVPFWGREVRDFTGGDEITLEPGADGVIGYPLSDLSAVPAGEYTVQAFLNVFTTFERSDGHELEMHLNSGAGQSPWRAPGNAMSAPRAVTIGDGASETIRLSLDAVIPSIDPVPAGGSLQQGNPADRGDLLRFVKIRSEALSSFWGRDMFIGANVLLPSDYESNPERRYPVLYLTGHFPGDRAPFGFDSEPGSGGSRNAGFTEFWRSPDSPKLILVSVRDANPFYDTGHSVNSLNVGPYGDAFTQELIPFLEESFRILPEASARVLAGGSTGGWEALAIQIFNPDFFGGAWGWCPDPVDFHYYQMVNVYEHDNAYAGGTEWVKVERPNNRRPDGTLVSTIRQEVSYERAVGPDGRSGGQWAIWEALFSPVGPDGYAAPIWDRVTGEIDREVAEYWRENWDLTHHLVTNWERLGPSLAGKLHITVGDMDSYYLNNAVELMEEALLELTGPSPAASFEYGRGKPHCWTGYSPWRQGEDLSNAEFVRVVDQYLKENGGRW
ncbi:MAG: enterochelin esterase-like enzyme [Gemmatimonadetes bacterium]|nr:enterochelin esterase-like enzyme [Gemmatimonadota bacterium]